MIIVGLSIGLVVAFGLVVLGLGLMVLWGSAGNLWLRWAAFVTALQSRGWQETQGTVTRSVVARHQWRRQVTYTAAIRYRYSVRGQRFESDRRDFDVVDDGTFETAQAAVLSSPVGSSVRVYYDEAAPRRATLARTVPSVVLLTLGWLVVALFGVAMGALGGDIVVGAFAEPPDLGELPSLREQVGGLLLGGGLLALAIAGVRALLERRTRRMLRDVASAKLVRAGEVRAGDHVAIYGRAEFDASEGNSSADADDETDDTESLAAPPFVDDDLLYLHTDLGTADSQLTRTTSLVVCDETGQVPVELQPGHGVLGSQDVRIEGEVERWLDLHDLDLGSAVSGDRRATMKVQRIDEGDPILVVGLAASAGASPVVLRARSDDPLSLLFADRPLPDLIAHLKKRPRVTLALSVAASLAIVAGAVMLVV